MQEPKRKCGKRHYGICGPECWPVGSSIIPSGVSVGMPVLSLEVPEQTLVGDAAVVKKPKFDRNDYHRSYMREYMRKRRAGKRGGSA